MVNKFDAMKFITRAKNNINLLRTILKSYSRTFIYNYYRIYQLMWTLLNTNKKNSYDKKVQATCSTPKEPIATSQQESHGRDPNVNELYSLEALWLLLPVHQTTTMYMPSLSRHQSELPEQNPNFSVGDNLPECGIRIWNSKKTKMRSTFYATCSSNV